VLEALLRRCQPDGWVVIDARLWKSVPMYRAGAGMGGAEARKVRQLGVLAQHSGCDVLVFTRDADKDDARVREIEEAVDRTQRELTGRGYCTREQFVELVEGANLDALPDDALSLRRWLERARRGLTC
jgi:hypothetical protein